MASASTLTSKLPGFDRAALGRSRWRWIYAPTVRQVELSLYLIALSGLMLWDLIPVPWALASRVLVAHIVGGALLMALVVGPFWWRHRGRLASAPASTRSFTGRGIEAALGVLLVSGVYLFFGGNDGAWDARLARISHLGLTFPLLAVLVLHVARASAMRVFWCRLQRRWPPARRGLA